MTALLLGVSLALSAACPKTVEEAINQLVNRGDVAAYHCMVARDDSVDELASRVPSAAEKTKPRLQRALVFALLSKADNRLSAINVSLLSPADRRLLADGLKAKRGRKSPSELHDHIFSQWDWYQPLPTYTDNRLRVIDQENIALVDEPIVFEAAAESAPEGCGCAVLSSPNPVAALMGLSSLLFVRRSRMKQR
jgi:hypothetical protein